MAALVNLPFYNIFDFARPTAAPYRNRFGQTVNAVVNIARFDHDSDNTRRGLLIEAGAAAGAHDMVTVKPGDWEISGKATVMFEYEDDSGIHRRAIYSLNMRETVNACMNIVGHLRKIGAVTGYLANVGGDFEGYVRYANADWFLGSAIDAGDGFVMSDADGRVMIESA